jgi:hypothetical protein
MTLLPKALAESVKRVEIEMLALLTSPPADSESKR